MLYVHKMFFFVFFFKHSFFIVMFVHIISDDYLFGNFVKHKGNTSKRWYVCTLYNALKKRNIDRNFVILRAQKELKSDNIR